MVRYFLTDFGGNPVYGFGRNGRRVAQNNNNNIHQRLIANRLSAALHSNNSNHNNNYAGSNNNSDSASFYTTTLVCHIRNRDWDQVLKRVATHPHEMYSIEGSSGTTVLHLACQLSPPPSIMKALAQPPLVRLPNAQGATPLHVAASHKCGVQALRVLLEAGKLSANDNDSDNDPNHEPPPFQEESTTTQEEPPKPHHSPTADLSRMGRAPIHYACMSFRGLDMDSFALLLTTTLQEGQLWVRSHNTSNSEPQSNNNAPLYSHLEEEDENVWDDHCHAENDEDDHWDNDSSSLLFSSSSHNNIHHDNSCGSFDDFDSLVDTFHNHSLVQINVMGLKDATGQTPLGLLFRRYRQRVRTVITSIDRNRDAKHRAALVAALRVHADLGELWEKARFIVARLTEERLSREWEGNTNSSNALENEKEGENGDKDNKDKKPSPWQEKQPPAPRTGDATSQRATYYGGGVHTNKQNGTTQSSGYYNPSEFAEPLSPAERAVCDSAAKFACERHPTITSHNNTLLPLAQQVATNKKRKFRIVHASVGLTGYGCPPELVRLAISIHPHQVTEMDEDGNLPLHIAVTAASYLATATSGSDWQEMMQQCLSTAADNDDHSVLSDAAMSFFSSATVSQTTNPFDKVIKILLEQYPESAQIPQGKTGRLPLVLAVESGRRTWQDGIRTLLNAYPPALHSKKLVEKTLYPKVLSLIASNGGCGIVDVLPVRQSSRSMRHEKCSRTTLFEVLRTKPEWLTLEDA